MKLIFHILFITLIFGNYSIIQSDSKIEYFGHHPMHSFSGTASSITLISDCNKLGDICDLIFKVPVISLNSGNDNRDSNMLNYLNVFSHPEIIFIIENFIVKEYIEEILSCEISIAGMSQEISVPLSLLKIKGHNQYHAKSSFSISLNEFNIEIPKLLFIPIDDEININIEFLIAGGNNK